MALQIVVAPDPRLLKKAEPVEPHELEGLKAIAAEMAQLMYDSLGCGLAAPQVGIAKRFIVIDPEWGLPDDEDGEPLPQNPRFLANPVIRRLWGELELGEEGCLSVPGIAVPIERYTNVEVEAIDLDGQLQVFQAEGFAARAFQHEIDHLDGKTMFERLDPLMRIEAIELYQAALAAGAKPGDTSPPAEGAADGASARAHARAEALGATGPKA